MPVPAEASPPRMSDRCLRLKRRANRSLAWLTDNLDAFSPMRNGHLDDLRVKAFAELALVYARLSEWKHLHLTRYLPAWRTFLLQNCEEKAYAQLARKRPAVAFGYLIPYLMLRSVGHRSAHYEDTLAWLCCRGHLPSLEVVPYRAFDQRYTLWKAGYVRREPQWRRLYRATVLGKCSSSLGLDEEGAYSVTHTVFYLTDFGNRTAPLSSADIERGGAIIKCLLVHYWRVGHWDLVGELLIGLNCLGLSASCIGEGAAAAFEGAWQDDGTILAKQSHSQEQGSGVGSEDVEKRFQRCYHPTLVGVLYCASSMNRVSNASQENLSG